MQPNVEFASTQAVETIEPADGVVTLENAHFFSEVRQADTGGEA
jgi:hypothetical protein